MVRLQNDFKSSHFDSRDTLEIYIQENLIINGIKILHLSTHMGGGVSKFVFRHTPPEVAL